ncbi:MAG: alanine racemase, partial [Desulfobacula sp.]
MTQDSERLYDRYKSLFKDERFPLAFVDLDRFDRNVAYVAKTQEKTGKTIRVASKSIRCPALIQRVFDQGRGAYKGILAFTMEEAGFLSDHGFDDIVVAYPCVRENDLALFAEKTRKGADICLMTDCRHHLSAVSRAAQKEGVILNVALDMDMSFRPLGSLLNLGVRRSPVHSLKEVLALAKEAGDLPGIRIKGLMGYEAQIASVNDDFPSHRLPNRVKNMIFRAVKKFSVSELTKRRGRVVRALRDLGIPLDFVNGGGSGSLVSTGQDESVTEVTAGSAFFAPGLFRFFHEVSFEPSAFLPSR